MSAEIQDISSLYKKVIITLPHTEILNKKRHKMVDYSKRAQLDGFRKGMIPAQVMEKRYGRQAIADAISELFDAAFQQALKDNDLQPVGEISFDEQPAAEEIAKAEHDLRYVLSFEIYPKVTLNDFANIKIEKPSFEITDQDVEEGLAKLQQQFATYEKVERAAEDADELTIDFVGKIDDKEFEGGTANDVIVRLGSKKFIEGFEAGLIGLKAGEETTLNLSFPQDYVAKQYAGRDVSFHIKLKSVAKMVPAPIDESLALRLGINDASVDKIREQVKTNMQKYAEASIANYLREQAAEQITKNYTFDLPESLIKEEKKHILADMNNIKNATHDDQLNASNIEKDAAERVKVALLINEIIKTNALTPDTNKVKQKIFELTYSGLTNDFFKKNPKQSKQIVERIKQNVLAESALDLVVAGATVIEKPVKFSEVADGSVFKNP